MDNQYIYLFLYINLKKGMKEQTKKRLNEEEEEEKGNFFYRKIFKQLIFRSNSAF